MKENFIRVGEYHILIQDPSESHRPQQISSPGCIGIRFKFFVSGDESPILCFHTKLVRTHLSPLPAPTSAWCLAQSAASAASPPILVTTAPCGVAGFIANPSELARPVTDNSSLMERDHVLSQWRRLHKVNCTTTIDINIAGSRFSFPRSAVFLLNPPQSNAPHTPLLRQVSPHASVHQLTPLQLFQEIHLQEFGSVNASSVSKPTFFDALSSAFATSPSNGMTETLNAQANALASASVAWRPGKRGRAMVYPTASPGVPDDADQDYARPFLIESLPLHISHPTNMNPNEMEQTDTEVAPIDSNMDTDLTGQVLSDQEELLDDADVFDDRVEGVEAWDFEAAPPKKSASASIGAIDSMYMTPGNVFSPGIDIPRGDAIAPYSTPNPPRSTFESSTLDSRMLGITTPAPAVPSSLPTSAPKAGEDADEEEFDHDSDVSSHLSFSDEEEALANRTWVNSLNAPVQSFSDICPASYKPLTLPKPELPGELGLLDLSSDPNMMTPAADINLPVDDGTAIIGLDGMVHVEEDAEEDSDSDDMVSDSDDATAPATTEGYRSAAHHSTTHSTTHNTPHSHWALETPQDEPSALFTGTSTNPSSFSSRSFAITAWMRLASYSAGDSAQLCFTSQLCNFFETTSGALIANFWPLLFNSEVMFRSSTTHQASIMSGTTTSHPNSANPFFGHSHSVTRNDATMSGKNEVVLAETLDREAMNINSPLQGFGDLTWRSHSDLSADVFRMYLKLDQTRLALWNQSGGSISAPGTPHTAMPAITPNTVLTADDIFSAEWSSLSGTQIGPITTEDWINGRNLGFDQLSTRKAQFTSKWSGSYECSSSPLAGSASSSSPFTWPTEHRIRNVEAMYVLSQLASDIFGNFCLGSGTNISGPLRVDRFQNMLCGPGRPRLSPGDSSSMMQIDKGTDPNSANTDGSSQHEMIEVLADPIAVLRYGEEGSMELPVTALYAWEKLNLRPLSPPKDVTYYVLAPSHIALSAVPFFRQLSAVYSQCNLGSHACESSLTDSAGIVAVPFPSGLDEYNRLTSTAHHNTHAGHSGDASTAQTPTTPVNLAHSSNSNASSLGATESKKFAWGSTAYAHSNPQQATISPFAITEAQLASYEEWATKLAERLATSRQYNKSIIIYVVSPFTLEASTTAYAGDARSTFGSSTAGLTRAQQVIAQRSATSLLHTIWSTVRKSNIRNLIVHGVSQNRVTAPNLHIAQLKEVAFNVYTKCRRVLLSEASRDQREPPKLYEPLFVLGTPSPNLSKDPFSNPSMALAPREKDFTLHVAYVVTSRTLTWSMCDSIGEILECSTLPTYSTITLALVKLLERAMQTLVDVGHKWKIVIGKLGMLSPGEVSEWHQAVKEHFTTKPNSQLVVQVSLVAFQLSDSLDVLPTNVFPESTTHANSEQAYTTSLYGSLSSSHQPLAQSSSSVAPSYKGNSTLAIFDTKPDSDAWDSDLLAQSHIITVNNQWQHSSAWSPDSTIPLTTSLYSIFTVSHGSFVNSAPSASNNPLNKTASQVDSSSDPALILSTIRHITRHYHQLSWLNMSPVSICRVDNLPLHFRLVRKLSNLVHAQAHQ